MYKSVYELKNSKAVHKCKPFGHAQPRVVARPADLSNGEYDMFRSTIPGILSEMEKLFRRENVLYVVRSEQGLAGMSLLDSLNMYFRWADQT